MSNFNSWWYKLVDKKPDFPAAAEVSNTHTLMLYDLIHNIRRAKVAFDIPPGDSRQSDDSDYLEEVGRMTLEMLNPIVEL
jgi:hypothetical protein